MSVLYLLRLSPSPPRPGFEHKAQHLTVSDVKTLCDQIRVNSIKRAGARSRRRTQRGVKTVRLSFPT